jgi:hypothetical protein
MRFSIRDLLWVTLVVAMGLGWWVDHRRILRNLDRESRLAKTWRLRTGALEKGLKDEPVPSKRGSRMNRCPRKGAQG